MQQTDPQSDSYPWLKSYPANVDWHAPIRVAPLGEMIDETCEKYASQPAFDFMGKRMRWSDMGAAIAKMARGLADMGVGKGVRVGLFLPNCPYFLMAYYAVLKTGAIVVNLNPLYTQKELQHLIDDSGTSVVITADLKLTFDKMHALLGQSALEKIVVCSFAKALSFPKSVLFPIVKGKEIADLPDGDARILPLERLMDNDGAPVQVAIDPQNDVAVLQYTGGTTGVPKGAMLTHENVYANVEQACRWFVDARRGQEKMVGVLPFFHVFAMTAVMNLSVRLGFELVVLPRFDLEQTLKLIDKRKPTLFMGVPAIYNAINNHPRLNDFDLTSIKYCVSGGAPLPAEVKKQFEATTGCVLVEGYGLTESSPIVCVNPLGGVNKPGSIGLPLPQTIVEIRDPETHALLPRGERGELCVSGPQVMKAYWNNEAASAKTIIDGRLHTGDVAIIDEDGYVFIVDRLKDLIITNGYNVYPRNVEEAIYQHEAVEECIVAGIEDAQRGEIVKAWIKLKAGRTLDADGLKDFLKDHLSPMEMPRKIEFRDQPLPKTMIGKLSRKDIVAEEKAAREG